MAAQRHHLPDGARISAAPLLAMWALFLLSASCDADRDEVRFAPMLGGESLERPVDLGPYPAGVAPGEGLFVALQEGRVLLFTADEQFELLDIRSRTSAGSERGLLSVTLDPQFSSNGHLWVLYSEARDGASRLSRFTLNLENDPPYANLDSELVILEQPEPWSNHNGGAVRFGPDGMLYLSLGDGGGGGDPLSSGQDRNTLLGKVIRIDVRSASADHPYIVPPDNPLVDQNGARGEIWAYGLRNPWRMTFDPETGRLWLADVGQDRVEEIDLIERGGNYGWSRMEGSLCFRPPEGCKEAGMKLPVAEYTHADGCPIIGGIVYRGQAVPSLVGTYLYADFCSARIWALPVGGGEPTRVAQAPGNVSSFGVDASGEVYVATFDAGILKILPKG